MEKDDEVKGAGNSYDFGARFYDPRIARFFSPDPKEKSYPWQSTYVFAANSPIRFVDVNGEGPGDRIKAAKKYLGTKYKQQDKTSLRTENTTEALEYMDCSELVCRALAADNLTKAVLHKNTSGLIKMFTEEEKDKWHKSDTPKAGDIVLWKGHTGIVESYDEKTKKVSVIHATKYKSKSGDVESVVSEKYKLSYYNKKGASFYRPKEETPDNKNGIVRCPECLESMDVLLPKLEPIGFDVNLPDFSEEFNQMIESSTSLLNEIKEDINTVDRLPVKKAEKVTSSY